MNENSTCYTQVDKMKTVIAVLRMISVKNTGLWSVIRTKAMCCLSISSVRYLEKLRCLTLSSLLFLSWALVPLFIVLRWSETHEGGGDIAARIDDF